MPGEYAIGNSCADCPAGTYSTDGMATHCIPCPPGTYSEVVGVNSPAGCLPCDVGGYEKTSK